MDGLTIGYLAERNAWKWPDKEAIVLMGDEGRKEEVTYTEFNERTNRLARGLQNFGIKKGDSVAVYLDNNVETLETYLAAMKLGAKPVPVNHRFKGAEVRYVLSDSDARLLVYGPLSKQTVSEIHDYPELPTKDFLYIGEEVPEFARDYDEIREDADDAPIEIIPNRLDEATIMYTSGTTGQPKGCILTHDNLLMNVETSLIEQGGWIENDQRMLLVLPLFHLAAFGRFLNNLYTGDTTVLMTDFQPQRTMEVLEGEEITKSVFVPTMTRMLLDLDEFDSYDLSHLNELIIGAAPSDKELKQTIINKFNCKLTESFGQTEMSPATTRLNPKDIINKSDSVGRPVLNVQTKVIDPETGKNCGSGDIGRICYRGPTVFKGYHNMPEKNDEVFEDGWFKSSDLVQVDEDGFVYYAGRMDGMIISGGENIYPAEVEEVLHTHPSISDAAVVGVPDERWGERVKAAIVLQSGEELSEEEIIEYVEDRIANYKKPREVEILDELPRGPTGKIEKNELV